MEKNLLNQCAKCSNEKCKKNDYVYLSHCANAFRWVVFGISAGALLLVLLAIYLIVNISFNLWAAWEIPVIIAICYITIVTVTAMFFALKDIKIELSKQNKTDSGK